MDITVRETSKTNRKLNKIKNMVKLVRRIIEPEVEKHQEIVFIQF
jgi:hypothetical protein